MMNSISTMQGGRSKECFARQERKTISHWAVTGFGSALTVCHYTKLGLKTSNSSTELGTLYRIRQSSPCASSLREESKLRRSPLPQKLLFPSSSGRNLLVVAAAAAVVVRIRSTFQFRNSGCLVADILFPYKLDGEDGVINAIVGSDDDGPLPGVVSQGRNPIFAVGGIGVHLDDAAAVPGALLRQRLQRYVHPHVPFSHINLGRSVVHNLRLHHLLFEQASCPPENTVTNYRLRSTLDNTE